MNNEIIKPNIAKDLIKVLSGNVVAQGFAFLTLVFISRDLGPEGYGVFSLLLAIFTFSVQVSDFGASTGYIKYVTEADGDCKSIFATTLISKILFSSFIVVALSFSADQVSNFFFGSNQYAGLIMIISFSVLFHSVFNIFVVRFQANQEFKIYSALNISHNFLKLVTVMILAVSFHKGGGLYYFVIVYAYSVLFLVVYLLSKHYKEFFTAKPNLSYFVGVYKLSFWVFLSGIATLVMMRLDVFMLQKISGSVEAGHYSAAMNLAMVFPLITASLVGTLLPKLNSYIKENSVRDYVLKVTSKAKYLLLVLLAIQLLAPILIPFVFGDNYNESVGVFQILLVAFTFGVIINPISLVIYYFNKAHLLTILNFAQLPMNFFGNLLLIPLWQGEGAAISTVFLKLVGGVFIYYIVNNYSKLGKVV